MIRILLVGGGSGGHVYPVIAVANALKERAAGSGAELELLTIGDDKFMRPAAQENGIQV
ncbi:MAG: glycosyltransferase, partial [Candidatus Yanofskybacteria bacterium]|nr:glycosyltransferase [Candidatus Yanofskybacteria bacterium]